MNVPSRNELRRELVRRIAWDVSLLFKPGAILNGKQWQEIADELQRASDIAQEEANDAPHPEEDR